MKQLISTSPGGLALHTHCAGNWMNFQVQHQPTLFLIGIPVTVLAILGLRMVDLERDQRRQQVAEQQSLTALLVDTSIAAMLNRIPGGGTDRSSPYG